MSKVFDQPFFKKVAGSRGRALADVRRRRNTHDFLGVPLLVLVFNLLNRLLDKGEKNSDISG
jgi:hypothetical protein